jgi:hypothetical protein
MAYQRSRARKRFEVAATGHIAAVDEARRNTTASPTVRDLAYCGAILLCSAAFESYIEDLLGDWGASVSIAGLNTNALPKRLRAFLLNHSAVLAAYKNYIADGDESSFLDRMEDQIGKAFYDLAADNRNLPRFSASLIYTDRKYPSPKNLQRLFGRFGINNIFQDMNRVAKRDTSAMLVSFNDLRTQMAHSGVPVGINARDIKNRIRDMNSVCGYVDRVFHGVVVQSVGPGCWRP